MNKEELLLKDEEIRDAIKLADDVCLIVNPEHRKLAQAQLDKILNHPRICIKAENQELPDMVFFCEDCKKMVKNTMCNIIEDNWVKVEK